MLRVIELFAGIGSQAEALKRLGIDHKVEAIVEWDKYAYASYEAIHGKTPNLGDITKVDKLPECDLLTYSFPCQDLSVAGKGAGIKEGTRSGLLLEVERLLGIYEKKPRYLLLENVKNLVGKQHKPDFDRWLARLEEMGYNNYWKVLNAKHYGIPQNRERVFVVSILKEYDYGTFKWPEPFDNGLRLKDFLEPVVDEKYYIDEEKASRLIMQIKDTGKANTNPSGRGMNGNVHSGEISPALTTNKGEWPKMCLPVAGPDYVDKRQNGRRFKEDGDPMFTLTGQDRHGVLVKTNNQRGYDIAEVGDTINFENLASTTRRGRVGKGVAQTINTMTSQGVVEEALYKCECGHIGTSDECEACGGMFDGEWVAPNECDMLGHIDINGHDYIKRVYSADGIAPTVPTGAGGNHEPKTMVGYRIRKLTPRECWRLMGQTDEAFEKAASVVSNSQLYKQAGNSIVVDVLEYIFDAMITREEDDWLS